MPVTMATRYGSKGNNSKLQKILDIAKSKATYHQRMGLGCGAGYSDGSGIPLLKKLAKPIPHVISHKKDHNQISFCTTVNMLPARRGSVPEG
jgi:hypothetical protein